MIKHNKQYYLGLDGELITENVFTILEQGPNIAKAKTAVKSFTPSTGGSSKTSSTTKDKESLAEYKKLVQKADWRILENIIYQTVFEKTIFILVTANAPIFHNEWATESASYGFKRQTHPLAQFKDYMYWWQPSKDFLFGKKGTFKENIASQQSWFFDNVWIPMLTGLDKLPAYSNWRKKDPMMQKIFDSVYTKMDSLIGKDWYNNSNVPVEITYVTPSLSKYPDEISEYFKQVSGVTQTSWKKTNPGQEQPSYKKLKYEEYNYETLPEQQSRLVGTLAALRGGALTKNNDEWAECLWKDSFSLKVKFGSEVRSKFYLSKPRIKS